MSQRDQMEYKRKCALNDIDAIVDWDGIPNNERADALQSIIAYAQAEKAVLDLRPYVSAGTVSERDNVQTWNAAAERERLYREAEQDQIGREIKTSNEDRTSHYAQERRAVTCAHNVGLVDGHCIDCGNVVNVADSMLAVFDQDGRC